MPNPNEVKFVTNWWWLKEIQLWWRNFFHLKLIDKVIQGGPYDIPKNINVDIKSWFVLESHFLWWRIIAHFVCALVRRSISKDRNLPNFYEMKAIHVSWLILRCTLQLWFFEKCKIQLARACAKRKHYRSFWGITIEQAIFLNF